MSVEDLQDLYEDYAQSIGVGISMSGPGRLASTDDTFIVSAGEDAMMTVYLGSGKVSYGKCSPRGRQLRLDAPLLASLIQHRGQMVEVDLFPHLADSLPRAARVCLFEVQVERGEDGPLEERVSWARQTGTEPTYRFYGPFGLEDLLSAARDTLLLAEPAEGLNCAGPHGLEDVGTWGAALPQEAVDLMALKFDLCIDCLNTLADLGFPLAPITPKEW